MFQAIRRHLNATSLLAVVALVFAMTGGAYAAKRYLITSTKQISPTVLKALKGNAGKNGAAGPAGPAGPGGPTGATGPGGSQGGAGAKGETGPQGSPGVPGDKGEKGATGSPWTPDSQLPTGATETGTWFAAATSGTEEFTSISFPIQISQTLSEAMTPVYVTLAQSEGEEDPSGCSGTAADPEAQSGVLCVFEGPINSTTGSATSQTFAQPGKAGLGVGPTGALILFQSKNAESHFSGTWAVTG
jgi:hypothetical protein